MKTSDFDDEVFGRGLTPEVRELLAEAGRWRGADPDRAQGLIEQARQRAPEHPAPLIALYRFHFYGHGLADARVVAEQALALGARRLGLPADWRAVPAQPLAGTWDDASTRFYLFALKGLAYLSLRLDDLTTAHQALQRLRALDPQNHVGGRLLDTVLARAGRDEDDEDGASAATADDREAVS